MTMVHAFVRRAMRPAAIALMLAVPAALPPVSAAAQQLDTRQAIGERIAIAGRQRMLAEGMAGSLCLAQSGVDRKEALQSLYLMWNIYGWYHRGILEGNEQLGLFAEGDPAVRATWAEANASWAGLRDIYQPAIQGGFVPRRAFDRAISGTPAVVQANTDLVATLRTAYAEDLGPRGFGTALLIDLYERQRMLAYKLVKETCLVSTRHPSATAADLARTLDLFDLSLDAFMTGRADAGVPKPPTLQISAKLGEVAGRWAPVRPLVARASVGGPLNARELSRLRGAMEGVLADMTAAIALLVAHERANDG